MLLKCSKNITDLKSHFQDVQTNESDFKDVITITTIQCCIFVIFGEIANIKAADLK